MEWSIKVISMGTHGIRFFQPFEKICTSVYLMPIWNKRNKQPQNQSPPDVCLHVNMVLQLFNAIRFEPCQFYRKNILMICLIQMFDCLCSARKIRNLTTRTTVIKYLKCWSGSRDIWNEIHSFQWNYPGWLWPSHYFSIPLASLNCCGEIIEEGNALLSRREKAGYTSKRNSENPESASSENGLYT